MKVGTFGIQKKDNLSIILFSESGRRGSNPRPSAWKANALSTELLPQYVFFRISKELVHIVNRSIKVGSDGFEPPKAKAS